MIRAVARETEILLVEELMNAEELDKESSEYAGGLGVDALRKDTAHL